MGFSWASVEGVEARRRVSGGRLFQPSGAVTGGPPLTARSHCAPPGAPHHSRIRRPGGACSRRGRGRQRLRVRGRFSASEARGTPCLPRGFAGPGAVPGYGSELFPRRKLCYYSGAPGRGGASERFRTSEEGPGFACPGGERRWDGGRAPAPLGPGIPRTPDC